MTHAAYTLLERQFRRAARLGEAAAVLNWDRAAMMPRGGAHARAEQLAELHALKRALLAAPGTDDLLDEAGADRGLDSWQRANVREMRRTWMHATALSEDLVMALARASAACEAIWRSARADADFAAVLPALETVLELVREASGAKANALGLSPYDALLDEYEPGARAAAIDRVFAELERELPPIVAGALARQKTRPQPIPLEGTFPVERQRGLAQKLMAAFGFDFAHGRLDVSAHPFCGGVPDDIRLTTRYDESDFASGLMSTLHETGHALYEMGLPAAWRGQPVGEARGMSLHESQSLLIEMQVCRSPEFFAFLAPMLGEFFGRRGPAWTPANLHALATRVRPGLIRVDADEATYPLHVILRHRLEQAMLSGDLRPRDLPQAWTEGMTRHLGLAPTTDREGCLQDIHWFDGAWGYFPSYTLGAMTAAQLFAAARRALPDLAQDIARGEFAPLIAWLGQHVHARAASVPTGEIVVAATGRPLDAGDFLAHLRARYLGES
ncbi:MAG: carboxypeptidase M32 [Rhodospirillales bacterium]|nr:carboxypeptidase M32 [Rhodospirillales bacterium]